MKKTVILWMLCILLPIAMEAKKKPFGNGLYWELTPAGELIISGNGAIPDYNSPYKAPWNKKQKKIYSITIENGITHVGDYAFCGWYWRKGMYENLKRVHLPKTLKSIGKESFSHLKFIEIVIFPESLNSIGEEAFRSCWHLKEAILPNSVTSLGEGVFEWCSDLTKVKLSQNLTVIPKHAFSRCKLKTIDLPTKVVRIDEGAFSNNELQNIIVPSNVIHIGNGAFAVQKSNVQQLLSIPNSVKTIGKGAFGSSLSEYQFRGRILSLPAWFTKNIFEFEHDYGISTESARYYLNSIRDNSGKVILQATTNREIEEMRDVYRVTEYGTICVVDRSGKVIIPASRKYNQVEHRDNYFSVTRDGNRGICNLKGNEIVAPLYSGITEVENDGMTYYQVRKSNYYGLVNSNGKLLIPAEMEDIRPIGSGFFKFEINGYWGVIDKRGETIISTSRGYTYIGNYISSIQRFPYTMNGYKGECDNQGRQVTKISTYSSSSSRNTAKASSTSISSISTSTGNIVNFEYYMYSTFSNGMLQDFMKKGDGDFTQYIIQFDLKTSPDKVLMKLMSVDKKNGNRTETLESYSINPALSGFYDQGDIFVLDFNHDNQRKVINVVNNKKDGSEKSILIADAKPNEDAIIKGKRFTPASVYEVLSPTAFAMLKGVINGYNKTKTKEDEKLQLEPTNFSTKYSQLKSALSRYNWKAR